MKTGNHLLPDILLPEKNILIFELLLPTFFLYLEARALPADIPLMKIAEKKKINLKCGALNDSSWLCQGGFTHFV